MLLLSSTSFRLSHSMSSQLRGLSTLLLARYSYLACFGLRRSGSGTRRLEIIVRSRCWLAKWSKATVRLFSLPPSMSKAGEIGWVGGALTDFGTFLILRCLFIGGSQIQWQRRSGRSPSLLLHGLTTCLPIFSLYCCALGRLLWDIKSFAP